MGGRGVRGVPGVIGHIRVLAVWACAGLAMVAGREAIGQVGLGDGTRDNPVFINDSPTAAEALIRVQENIAAGNTDQAVRVLQKLLDDEPLSLTPSVADPALFLSVRDRIHSLLLGDEKLLELYRRTQEPLAAEGLKRGENAKVEISRLMTPSGLTAALRVASDHLENARFHAALMTLESIERHPDRALAKGGPGATAAANLAGRLTQYLRSERALGLAERFAKAGGQKKDWPAVTPPLMAPAVSALSPIGPAQLSGIVAKPLAVEPYTTDEPVESPGFARNNEVPRSQRMLSTLPTVSGDAIYFCSARHVTALDRYTLRERWRLDVSGILAAGPDVARAPDRDPFARTRGFATAEDPDTVTVTAGEALTVVSSPAGAEDPREVVIAIDTASGRPRWRLDVAEIDPVLLGARVRGPIMVGDGVAVLTLRKEAQNRRVTALYAAMISIGDGRPLGLRLIGSIGSLPWNRGAGQVSDGGALHDGVFYRPDRMGLVAAYTAAEGRPVWVRRFASELYDASAAGQTYTMQLPVLIGDELTVITPDRRQVVTMDARTGAILRALPTDRLGKPDYLVPLGGLMAAIGDKQIVTFSAAAAVADGKPVTVLNALSVGKRAIELGIRGRVIAAGASLLVPVATGIAVFDGKDLAKEPATIALDNPGNIVYDGGQLIVTDDLRASNYLAWAEADRLLSARIAARKEDATSGVALAELAFRAGHPERILFGADAALGALAMLPGAALKEAANAERSRLAAALRGMAEAAHAGDVSAKGMDVALVGEIVERLGRIVVDSEEQVAFQLCLGQQRQNEGRDADAAAAFQRVLDRPELADAAFRGRQLSLRADSEATRRLEKLVTARGRGAYAAQDTAMTGALRALGQGVSTDDLERTARRFPVGRETPALWSRIATIHQGADRQRAAARALELGLQTSERMPDAPAAVVGELAGRLIDSYSQRGLLTAAADTLKRTRARFGELALTRDGKPLDGVKLAAELGARLAESRRWPRVGQPVGEGVQPLLGWTIVEPIIQPTSGVTPAAIVMSNLDKEIALFAPRPAAEGGVEGDGMTLQPIWTAPMAGEEWRLLKLDNRAAFLFSFGKNGAPGGDGGTGSLVRVDTATGQRTFRSEAISTYFKPIDQKRGEAVLQERFRHPLGSLLSGESVVVTMDERTIALVERGGRAVALDADSGAFLWSATTPVERVYDCAVEGNLLVIAGDQPVRPGSAAFMPVMLMLDARTGQVVQQYPPAKTEVRDGLGQMRWVRIDSRGEVIAGLEGGIVSIDPDSGRESWRNPQGPAVRTLGAWLRGDRMLLVAEDRQLWSAETATGTIRAGAVESRGRTLSDAEVNTVITSEGNFAVCSAHGVAIISPEGALLGTDALGATDNLIPPVAGQGVFVTMETGSTVPQAVTALTRPRNIGLGINIAPAGPGPEPAVLPYNLHVIDSRSGMLTADASLLLAEPPLRVALLDGRILVTAGHSTVVYRAVVK